jgi:hypothetical protein
VPGKEKAIAIWNVLHTELIRNRTLLSGEEDLLDSVDTKIHLQILTVKEQ